MADKTPSDFKTPECQTLRVCKYCGETIKASESKAKVIGEENYYQSVRENLNSFYGQDRQNFCSNSCALQGLKSEAVRRVKSQELKDSKSATSEKITVNPTNPDPFKPVGYNKRLGELDFLGQSNPNKLS